MIADFWLYIQNLGDGSCTVKFFKSKRAAEKYAAYDNERFCDDIYYRSLEFDNEGNLISPEPEVEFWKIKQYK